LQLSTIAAFAFVIGRGVIQIENLSVRLLSQRAQEYAWPAQESSKD